MNLNRWLSVILMLGLILILNPLGAQADPYQGCNPHQNYHRPNGNAYGWHGNRPHGSEYYQKYYRGSCMGPHYSRPYVHQVYAGPPPVAYVRPVTPIIGVVPYAQPQAVFCQPAAPGLHGQLSF